MIQTELNILFEAKPGKVADTTDPTVGGGGALSTDQITTGGFRVTWAKGNDNETSQANLKYLVYISNNANLDTDPATVEANGTLLNTDSQDQDDIAEYTLTGLANETTRTVNVILKDESGNKSIYTQVTETTLAPSASGDDSQAGDETALRDLYSSLNNPNLTGWGPSMTLSGSIEGVTYENIGGENRVTEIDLKNKGLTGNIENASIGNLKEMTLFSIYLNNLNSAIPVELFNCTKLVYLYLGLSDHVETDVDNDFPHIVTLDGGQTFHPGKNKASENNVWTGPLHPEIENLQSLEWFFLSWTDTDTDTRDGISSIPTELFNITSLVSLQLFDNWNLATLQVPSSWSNLVNMELFCLGGGSGTNYGYRPDEEAYLQGTYPDLSGWTKIRQFVVQNEGGLIGFPDLSGTTSLTWLTLAKTQVVGNMPSWLTDGTNPNMDILSFDHPIQSGGTSIGGGFAGPLPEFGITTFDLFGIMNHSMDGDVPLSFWTIRDGGPNKTNFSNNEFTSIGLIDMTDIDHTSVFRWSNNEIRGEQWPYLNWNDNSCTHAWFDNNYYVFRDMLYEPPNAPGQTAFDLWQSAATTQFRYSPQKPFGFPSSPERSVGQNITFDNFNSHVSHADNNYQWLKNGNTISGATNRSLTLTNLQVSDTGVYELRVTNPGVPGLTLISETIDLEVT